jgi:hypothetical protein
MRRLIAMVISVYLEVAVDVTEYKTYQYESDSFPFCVTSYKHEESN